GTSRSAEIGHDLVVVPDDWPDSPIADVALDVGVDTTADVQDQMTSPGDRRVRPLQRERVSVCDPGCTRVNLRLRVGATLDQPSLHSGDAPGLRRGDRDRTGH